jgi:hypothetical protein
MAFKVDNEVWQMCSDERVCKKCWIVKTGEQLTRIRFSQEKGSLVFSVPTDTLFMKEKDALAALIQWSKDEVKKKNREIEDLKSLQYRAQERVTAILQWESANG